MYLRTYLKIYLKINLKTYLKIHLKTYLWTYHEIYQIKSQKLSSNTNIEILNEYMYCADML